MKQSPWAVIARREYVSRVRSGAFRVGTILGPLILIAAAYLPAWLAPSGESTPIVGIIDRAGVWAGGIESESALPGVRLWPAPADIDDETAASFVADRVVDAVFIVSADAAQAELVTASSMPPSDLARLRSGLERALHAALIQHRGRERGLDEEMLGALLLPPHLRIRMVPGTDPAQAAGLAVLVAMLLYATLLTHGLATMRAIVDEKAHRVVELLLSSVRPADVVKGKVVGIAAVGVTQYAVWLLMATAVLRSHGPMQHLSPSGALPPLDGGLVAACLAYFVLGYALFAALYVMVGGMVSLPADAQHVHLPVTALLVMPVFLVWPVVASPATPTSRILSLVPLFAPVLMPARLAMGGAGGGETFASILIVAGSAAASLHCAVRVYSAGIFRRGAPPSFREVGRWIRSH